jgi:hypothetical protein
VKHGALDREISLLDCAPTISVLGGIEAGDGEGAPVAELC